MVRHQGVTPETRRAATLALILAPVLALAPAAGGLRAEEMQRFDAAGGTPQAVWVVPLGEARRDEDQVDAVAVDGEGNATFSGIFQGRLELGGQSFDAQGPGDIFVASYSRDGAVRWVHQFGAGGNDNTFDMAVDGAGNIYLSGWFEGRVDFGGITLASQGGQDMFLVKLDAAGNTLWARSFGGPRSDGGNEIFVLPGGEIAVAAISEGDFAVDGQNYPGGGGERDSYVMRLNRAGEVRWVVPAAGPGTERIRAISMNEAGEVFVGFQYRGSVSIGGQVLQAQGGWDGAAAKLSPEGQLAWLLPVGGPETDNVRGIAAGPGGSVYIAGQFSGPAMMIDREVPSIGSDGDEFVVRLSGDGAPRWIVSFGGPGKGTGAEIEADPRGVIVSSMVTAPTVVRRNRDTIAEVTPEAPSAYLAGFTEDGQIRFLYMPSAAARRSGTLGDTVAVSPDGRYVLQALRFRGSVLAAGQTITTASQRDSAVVFVALNGG